MLRLRYEEQGVSKIHPLKQGITVVGRLPTSDLVLFDPSVSRQHASLRVVGTECHLKDAGSRFGTFLNGEMVRDEAPVAPGATIKLGEVSLVLEQYMAEQDLLGEDHQISEGPGTILRPIAPDGPPSGAGDGHLIRLLSDVNRTLLTASSLADVSDEDIETIFGVNTFGPLYVASEAAKRLPDGGRVINFSSSAAHHPMAGAGLYMAAKKAIESFTENWARELGKRNITVNTIIPGATSPGMIDAAPQYIQMYENVTPAGRIGTSDEIAAVVAFLASPEASWVTGGSILANGAGDM